MQTKQMQDMVNAYNWAFGIILGEKLPTTQNEVAEKINPNLWKCSVCRERVSKNAIEIIDGLPVCWGCIDEKKLK